MKSIEAVFKMKSWEEAPAVEPAEGQKLTKATVAYAYEGALQGTSHIEFVMAYITEAMARFVGVEVFEGSVEGREGSFMLIHEGTFAGGTVKSVQRVVEGSGSGELKGISGEIQFESGHAEEYPITFNYAL